MSDTHFDLTLLSHAQHAVEARMTEDVIEIRGDLPSNFSKVNHLAAQAVRQFCLTELRLGNEEIQCVYAVSISRKSHVARHVWHIQLPNHVKERVAGKDFNDKAEELINALAGEISFEDSPPGNPLMDLSSATPSLAAARGLRSAASGDRTFPAGTRLSCTVWESDIELPKVLGAGPMDRISVKPQEEVGYITGSDWFQSCCGFLRVGSRKPIQVSFDEVQFGAEVEDARKNRHGRYLLEFETRFKNQKAEYSTLVAIRLVQGDLLGDTEAAQ